MHASVLVTFYWWELCHSDTHNARVSGKCSSGVCPRGGGVLDICENWGFLLQVSPTRRAYLTNVMWDKICQTSSQNPVGKIFRMGSREILCLHDWPHHVLSTIIYSHVNMHIIISINPHFALETDCINNRPLNFLLTSRLRLIFMVTVITKLEFRDGMG